MDLAHDATVGERSRNSKFSTHHQDQSTETLATREREGVHLHTIEDVGEHSNFKKIPTHTQDHGDA